MTALARERVSSIREVTRDKRPLAAGVKVWKGALACAIVGGTGRGFYRQGLTSGSVVPVGRFMETVDNTAGAAGDLSAEIHFFHERHLFLMANDGGTPVVVADREQACYVLDDQTVSGAAFGASRGGVVYDVTSEGVWVEVAQAEFGLIGRPIAEWNKAADDGAANTATSETIFGRVQAPRAAAKLLYIPSAALTGDNTNNATLLVQKRDGAGGAAQQVAARTTTVANGNWLANQAVDLGAITNGSFVPGDLLTITISKGGTGVVVPRGQLVVL